MTQAKKFTRRPEGVTAIQATDELLKPLVLSGEEFPAPLIKGGTQISAEREVISYSVRAGRSGRDSKRIEIGQWAVAFPGGRVEVMDDEEFQAEFRMEPGQATTARERWHNAKRRFLDSVEMLMSDAREANDTRLMNALLVSGETVRKTPALAD